MGMYFLKVVLLFILQKHTMLEIENSTKPVREVFCKQKIRLEQTKLQYTQIQWKLTDCSSLGFLWTTIIHCNKYLNMTTRQFSFQKHMGDCPDFYVKRTPAMGAIPAPKWNLHKLFHLQKLSATIAI